MTKKEGDLGSGGTKQRGMTNGAKLGGATGAMAPLVFWSQSLKKSRNQSLVVVLVVSKWHQLILPSFGANVYETMAHILHYFQ